MSNVKPFPSRPKGEIPRRIIRPCDWGFASAVSNLEIQLGTIEAFNRLVAAAEILEKRIAAGDIKPQNPLYASSISGKPLK